MEKRTAIITGASSGIGAATALRLAGDYAGLVLHARKSAHALEQVAHQVRKNGTDVVLVMGELSDEGLGERLVSRRSKAGGGLIAFGFPILKSFDEGSPADLDHAFKGNVYSLFALARAAATQLKASP